QDLALHQPDGSTIGLADYLWTRELGDISEPVIAPHPVTHTFTPPVVLALSGTPLARISSVSATLGEVELPQDHIVLDGRALAWMIANVLDSTRLWFTDTDLHVTTDTDTEPVVTDVVLGRPKTKPGS
ncbi:MAG: hypothetical protein ACREX8_10925, partial [Gammaproteobacteria bacterium]